MAKVSELLALKIENSVLKIQQLQAAGDRLMLEQKAFVEQARAEVGAPSDHVYNVALAEFQEP